VFFLPSFFVLLSPLFMFDDSLECSLLHQNDEHFMRMALREAENAYKQDEVPIGAVIVHENRIIGRGYNQTERLQDPTAHAEMIAITAAATHLASRRLLGCTIYVTLEPCSMCAGAIVLARIPRLIFAATDPKAGATGTLYNITQDQRLNHRCEVISGVLGEESSMMLKSYFAELRKADARKN
jgi:tRNA(adenine34) deaminase